MMNMDGPLDFEFEDPPVPSSLAVSKRSRKKAIGLDDLLTDYYKEKSKVIERESKRAKARKSFDSDEDKDDKEAFLSKKIDECHNQMKEMSGEEETTRWGIEVFGNQKTFPPLAFPELGNCSIFKSFMGNELNSLVELTTEKGETFLEGLLVNGWLSKLFSVCGHVEKSIAKWTYNLILYSPKEELRTSACDFWCSILSHENKAEKQPIRIGWLPTYFELKKGLEAFGFLFNILSQTEPINSSSGTRGPPQNIRAWIKFADACCHARNEHPIFSVSEMEELVEITIFLSLDRQLQGCLLLLYQLMQSTISYFTDDEWDTSYERIARFIACRVPKDLNCLRSVECISGVTTRIYHLRSAVSYQTLLAFFDKEAANEEEILNSLISINMKDKKCDLFRIYIYLILAENWLLSIPTLDDKPVINEMWGLFLRSCSCQITSTDMRPYASQVRTKASYLLHGTKKN